MNVSISAVLAASVLNTHSMVKSPSGRRQIGSGTLITSVPGAAALPGCAVGMFSEPALGKSVASMPSVSPHMSSVDKVGRNSSVK